MPFEASLYLLAAGPEGVREAIEGGVDIVQLRDKDSPDHVLTERIEAVKAITDAAGVPLIINDRPDLCLRFDAAGVHLGQEDMSVAEARELLGPERVIGISTHSLEMALQADEAGVVDYIAIGWWGLIGAAFTLTEVTARIKRNKNARLRREDKREG